ncbi:hypothetical protein [Streptomyces sp. x-80]|uniref:hypothetical protein n=1 Tax=Streptomyces sp. x-80 TaxID=2789282 RepID=UPI0039811F6B
MATAVHQRQAVAECADAFPAGESGVALVGAEDLGRRVAGEPAVRVDGSDAAGAQRHLLAQPVCAAAAVEPLGDPAPGGAVLRHLGVERQRDPADQGLPDGRVRPAPAGQGERAARGPAVELPRRRPGQLVRVEDRVALPLPASRDSDRRKRRAGGAAARRSAVRRGRRRP